MRSVVVTGVGTVGPYGCGIDALVQALQRGAPAFTPLDPTLLPPDGRVSRTAGLAASEDLTPWLAPRAARRMSPASRYAVASAKMALQHAGLEPMQSTAAAVVALSFTIGPASSTEKLLRQIHEEGPTAASPFEFTESVANAPAAQVALAVGARGSNFTVTQKETGTLLALGRGVSEVGSGRADLALVGAVDEITPLTHSIFEGFHALARSAPGEAEVPRPFDRNRDGFVLSEGATVLVLEAEDDARSRGASLLARVRTVFGAHDPTAPVTDWGRGEEILAEVMRRRIEAARVSLQEIDGVVSGASGAVRGDRLEGRTLRELFGERMPVVLAPKGVTGECGGGFFAGVVAALSASTGPTVGFREEDPTIGVTPHRDGILAPRERVLVSALAAGGSSAWALMEAA